MAYNLREKVEQAQQKTEKPQFEVMQYSDEYKGQVKDLIFDVYENERGWNRTVRPDLDKIKEIYQNFWVAIEKRRVIGTIGLRNQGRDIASMHRFCVAKIFRGKGKGVSGKLYSTFLEFAKNNGYKKIVLGTTPDAISAIKFYERNGFVKIESLPEDIIEGASLSQNELFYELDLENS